MTTHVTQLDTITADIKHVCQTIGPQILGNLYPTNSDGTPKETLTSDEAKWVFEHVTREFWRQQVEAVKVAEATEVARLETIEATSSDPFEE